MAQFPTPRQVMQHPTFRQFIKFGLVGVLNTLTNTLVYLAGTRGLKFTPLSANAVAFVVAVTLSFTLNRRWTFRSTDVDIRQQYVKFMIVSLFGFGWAELIIYVGHYVLGWHDLVAYAASVILVLFWNFFFNKFWTFRKSAPQLA